MAEIPLSFSANFSEFDAQEAGKALDAQPRTTRDLAHGDGEAMNLGETTLEVYPDAGVTRVTTPDARIELFRVPGYTITGERVVFEQGEPDDRTRLLVRKDGKVSFYPVLKATDAPRTRETAANGDQDSPAPHVSSETATTPNGHPEGDKGGEVEQQQLQGRLGRDPWFSTRDDRPAAGFPLAVNQEGSSKATWHNVVTLDDSARQLRESFEKRQIAKGRLVDVTGQPVIVEEPRANGGVKKSVEFHATAVTRVQSRPAR